MELKEKRAKKCIKVKQDASKHRQVICPAIYKHFKHREGGIPNNYIYATMFISKPLDIMPRLLSTSDKQVINVTFTESHNRLIYLVAKDGQYYHNSKDCKTDLVVYKPLYDNHIPYARPLDMFLSKVDREKYPDVKQEFRFELMS